MRCAGDVERLGPGEGEELLKEEGEVTFFRRARLQEVEVEIGADESGQGGIREEGERSNDVTKSGSAGSRRHVNRDETEVLIRTAVLAVTEQCPTWGEDLLIEENVFSRENDCDPTGGAIGGGRAGDSRGGADSARGEEISPDLVGLCVPVRFLEQDR